MKQENQNLSSLFELAEVLSYQNNFQETLRLVTDKALEIFKADFASVVMINPRTQKTVKTIIRKTKREPLKGLSIIQTNVIGWMMVNRQSFLCEDINEDTRFSEDLFIDLPIGAVMATPLRCSGSVIGYLVTGKRLENQYFSPGDLALIEKFALVIAPYLGNTQKIQEYFNAPLPENALVQKYASSGLLGKCATFLELLHAVDAAARCDARVLLEGKTGTGKELIARAIHRFSARSAQPFIAIDCGAIPENLLESELFGHVKGAFTGATTDRQGLMEAAHGGTLFIDEIANLPLPMQTKLMRALQENEIRPLGSNKPHKIDVRIISASSTSMRELMSAGRFREDLFYRLYVYPIKVPALSERGADIPMLADFFLKRVAQQQGKETTGFTAQLVEFIKSRTWDGNIRELENFVERVVAVTPPEAQTIESNMLPVDLKEEFTLFLQSNNLSSPQKSLKTRLHDCEAQILREVLEETQWNQTHAAQVLDTTEQLIRYRMKKLGINRPE